MASAAPWVSQYRDGCVGPGFFNVHARCFMVLRPPGLAACTNKALRPGSCGAPWGHTAVLGTLLWVTPLVLGAGPGGPQGLFSPEPCSEPVRTYPSGLGTKGKAGIKNNSPVLTELTLLLLSVPGMRSWGCLLPARLRGHGTGMRSTRL